VHDARKVSIQNVRKPEEGPASPIVLHIQYCRERVSWLYHGKYTRKRHGSTRCVPNYVIPIVP
jgi:hypothetical protein